MTRKQQTEAYLRVNGIKINPHLPELTAGTLRTQEEMLRRGVAAFLAAQIAVDVIKQNGGAESAAFFRNILDSFGLGDELTPDEQRLFALADGADESALTETFVNAMAWRTEMCMPLFRACGLLQESMYFPDRPSDLGAVVRLIQPHSDFASLLSACGQPATEEQLMDGADLIYRMDWACVDARLKGAEPPGGLNYDVVMEQHKGFLWMIGAYDAENWDTVKPHT